MSSFARWIGFAGLFVAAGCGRSGVPEVDGVRFPVPALPGPFGDGTPGPTPTASPFVSPCDVGGDPDLVGCWSFDGNFLDGSVLQHPVTVSAVLLGDGVAGGSAMFDATSDFQVTSNAAFDLTNMTVETWVYLTALPANTVTVLHRAPTIRISITQNGAAECRFDGSELSASASGAIQPGQWTHVACTFDADDAFLVWVDAVSADQGSADGGPGTSTTDLQLGARTDGSEPLSGQLDAVRLWKRILTQPELCTAAGFSC